MQPTPTQPQTAQSSSMTVSPQVASLSPTALALRHSAQAALPSFDFPQEGVDARRHVASGTALYTTIGYLAVAVFLLVAILGSGGVFLAVLAIGAIIGWFQARKVRAYIRGSGVQVSATQLPELHAMVESFSRRLGLSSAPEMYIVEESVQNGFAVKLGKKNLILLTDDMVWGALRSRDPRALGFIVGHELAHIALNHTGTFRSSMRATFRPLARADELSSDNVAAQLVGDKRIAIHGLALLTVGPQLLPYINEEAMLQQAREVSADRLSKKAESALTHPLLMRRIGNLMG
jgi:Zn-dependent protease with chaperone function